MSDKLKKTIAVCEMCQGKCRVLVHTENGQVVKVEGDRTYPRVDDIFPPTSGCIRLQGVKEWVHHPDRVNFPLKRAGEKGQGKWLRISWDQALDEIAEKLKEIKDKYGAEALAHTGGTNRTTMHFAPRFLNQFGTPNAIGHNQVCRGVCVNMSAGMFGWPLRHRSSLTLEKDATGKPRTRCVLLTGVVADQSTLRLWKTVRDAREKIGTKVIVIDPRRTATAEIADIWLQPRPSTNAALLLSMIHVTIAEELYDKGFVEKWCYGFEALANRAREYCPEKMAEVTWVPAEKISEAARMFATNRPAVGVHGMGHEHHRDTVSADQARFALMAITGNIDIEGGEYLPGLSSRWIPGSALSMREKLSAEQKQKQIGIDRFREVSHLWHDFIQGNIKNVRCEDKPFGTGGVMSAAHAPSVYRAMVTGRPYPVRAAITLAANPMVTAANTKLVYNALRSLDLYVVSDFWITPSAELADYVLPAAMWLERPYLEASMNERMIGGNQALPNIVPGKYERKHDYNFWRGLGLRLGQDWPWETLEETYDYQLKPTGMTFRQFMEKGGFEFSAPEYKKYEKKGFATTTGKVELYSKALEKFGYDPLPEWKERHPMANPELAKEFPLYLITGGRFLPMYHSEHRQINSVRKRHPHPLVQVNPKTAKELGIENGDWVWIESPMGRIRQKCQHFDGIHPRVVHCEHGWWFPELPGEEPWLHGVFESNANVLIDDDPANCDPIGGGWPLKGMLCKIYKVKRY